MTRELLADRLATISLWTIALFVVALLAGIIVHLVWSSLGMLSIDFLLGDPNDFAVGGIGPLLWNSLYMLVLTLLLTVPLGLLGGIYMAEYAQPSRLTDTIRFSQELIGSVPSIVVGLFGLALFVNTTGWGFTALAGALALTVFNLPLMARLVEQAVRAVPADERQASLALGASKWTTIVHVVLPTAIPGLVTAVILSAGRIFGEAAALIFTAGLATPSNYDFANLDIFDPRSPWSPFRSTTTLAVYIWKINSEGLGSFVREVADASAAILVIMVLFFDLAARAFGRFLQVRMSGV